MCDEPNCSAPDNEPELKSCRYDSLRLLEEKHGITREITWLGVEAVLVGLVHLCGKDSFERRAHAAVERYEKQRERDLFTFYAGEYDA